MLLNRENQTADNLNFLYDTIYFQSPGDSGEAVEDEEDENFDDMTEDMDDLHEIQANDDIGEPLPDDDDHFPDDDLQ
jgi:hypothetical protein